MNTLRRFLLAAAAAAFAGLAGCASLGDPNVESDIPWNRQESWEGQMLMPGSMMPRQH